MILPLLLMLITDVPAKPAPDPTVIELKAEIRLLKAQLASTQIQCQIAALPEVQKAQAEMKDAQAAYEAAKPKQVETSKNQ